MHRIDTEGNTTGTLTDGNPAGGVLGTLVDAAWYQDVQDNICRVIEEANIALVKGDVEQLHEAIVAIAQGVGGTGGGGGGGGGGGVPTSRRIVAEGLVTGGGALNADVDINVAIATAADITNGNNDVALTPAVVHAFMGDPAAESMTHLNGKIEKEGSLRGSVMGPQVYQIAFQAPFPNACTHVTLTPVNSVGSGARDNWFQLISRDQNGFSYVLQGSNTGGDNNLDGLDWYARGH